MGFLALELIMFAQFSQFLGILGPFWHHFGFQHFRIKRFGIKSLDLGKCCEPMIFGERKLGSKIRIIISGISVLSIGLQEWIACVWRVLKLRVALPSDNQPAELHGNHAV